MPLTEPMVAARSAVIIGLMWSVKMSAVAGLGAAAAGMGASSGGGFMSAMGGMAGMGNMLGGLGGLFGSKGSSSSSNRDRAFQKQLAQNQIQWRVADAIAAGVHPLAALGISPQSGGGTAINVGDYGGSGFQQMSQDISRAKMAAMDARERQAAYALALREAQRADERHKMDMALAGAELASRNARLTGQVGPGVNTRGYNIPSPRFQPRPSDPVVAAESNPSRSAGHITDYQYRLRSDGGIDFVPSADVAERQEDNLALQWDWFMRNQLAPRVTGATPPMPPSSEYPVREGYERYWDQMRGAWYTRPIRRRAGRRRSYSQRPGNF